MSSGSPSTKAPRPLARARRWKRVALSCYRLGLLAAAFLCLHLSTAKRERGKTDSLDPARVLPVLHAYLPAAASIGAPEGDDRLCQVLDAKGELVGWVAQTSPESAAITGYAGPSNLLVVFDTARRVAGVRLLESADTPGHVAKVEQSSPFFSQWNGRPQASLGSPGTPAMVSGASLTSEAMARGVAARFGGAGMDRWFPGETDMATLRSFFPAAASLVGSEVRDAKGSSLGTLLRSSKMGVSVRGFQGATDVIVAIDDSNKTILGVAMPGSRDNEPYISDVKDVLRFDSPFAGMALEEAAKIETGSTVMVSGASRTAESVEESVKEMLRRHLAPPPEERSVVSMRDGLALGWIAAGCLFGLSPLRGRKSARTAFAIASVLVGGLWLGLMTAQDQWIKWSIRGNLAGAALPLLALTASVLLIPAVLGKNVYCSQLCPHGAAQQLIGLLRKRRFALPAKLHRVLLAMPWLTLLVLWLLAFLGIGFPFANAEPFEIWSAGFVALLPVLIFAAGLVAAVFLPQAYCHYGCPTGAVLKFLASSPGAWTRRDSIVGSIVALGWIAFLLT